MTDAADHMLMSAFRGENMAQSLHRYPRLASDGSKGDKHGHNGLGGIRVCVLAIRQSCIESYFSYRRCI